MKAAFLVHFSGGELRAGEIEQIRQELLAAAHDIEPLMDISVTEFYTVPGPGVVEAERGDTA